jgi:hypothetical protein
MNHLNEAKVIRSGRLRSGLMMFGALILFAAGLFLLIAPKRAHAGEVGDNVIANDCHLWG